MKLALFDCDGTLVDSAGLIHETMPHSTRRRLARGLKMLRNKDLANPWKKHDNIPL